MLIAKLLLLRTPKTIAPPVVDQKLLAVDVVVMVVWALPVKQNAVKKMAMQNAAILR
jgi:hypothetical protein